MSAPEMPKLPPPLPRRRKRWVLPIVVLGSVLLLAAFCGWGGWAALKGVQNVVTFGRDRMRREKLQWAVAREITWYRRPGSKIAADEIYRRALDGAAADEG